LHNIKALLVSHRERQGCCPWSLDVLKDKTGVLGPGLGLESLVHDPSLGLEA